MCAYFVPSVLSSIHICAVSVKLFFRNDYGVTGCCDVGCGLFLV